MRHLAADEVIDLAASAGLEGIEWGADRHVRPGDLAGAALVSRRSADLGLASPSYGTYVFAGRTDLGELDAVLDTAGALGAPHLRVWCQPGVEPNAPPDDRRRVTDALLEIAERCGARGLAVSTEFHPGTLTHTAASTRRVLDSAAHPALWTYWQPDPTLDPASALAEWRAVADRVTHLHVFWWDGSIEHRRALADGAALWRAVLADAATRPTHAVADRWAFLEYVRDDDPHQLHADAATLRRWLEELP